MRFEAYRELIRRLEAEAAADPSGYTLRVAAFGALGYVYILGTLLLLFGVMAAGLVLSLHFRSGGVGWLLIKLGIATLPLGVILARAVCFTPPAPRGIPLTRERVPELFALLDEVRAATRAPAVDRVLLTPDFNASVLQQPRLGIFGWPRNYLVLGLPMLETLSPARLRSVLAHELGHLQAGHSTFAGRLFTVSHVWRTLLAHFDSRRGLMRALLAPFFRWYAPRFGARGFVLGRRAEYFADACARAVAGERATRSALVRIEVMSRRHAELMTALLERVREQPAPPERPISTLACTLREDPPAERARAWLDEALRVETGCADTHPALRDRLEGLRPGLRAEPQDACAEPGPSAAQRILAAAHAALSAELDAAWVAAIAPEWRERHAALSKTATRLAELDALGKERNLSRDDEWNRVAARLELKGAEGAYESLATFVATHPDHALARFRLGQQLLDSGDDAGLAELERAMALDTDATQAACEAATGYLRRRGRAADADAFVSRAWRHGELLEKSRAERRFLRRSERFEPHGLPDETIAALRERLAREPWLAAAYVARKRVMHRTEKPCYVFGLVPHRPWYRLADPQREAALAKALIASAPLPEGTWGFLLTHSLAWAKGRLAKVEGAEVWSRRTAHPVPDTPRPQARRAA